MFGISTFHRTAEVIEAGIRDGSHLGAQLYVSLAGEPVADLAFGEAQPAVPMTPDTLTLWFSAGKPLTAIAVAQLVERGELAWDTAVAARIPEFAVHGKEQITVRHLLTHTAGLHAADDLPDMPWNEKIARICDTPLPSGWLPGERGAYSSQASWFILGEIVARASGLSIADYIRHHIAAAAKLDDTRLSFSEDEIPDLRARIGFMYDAAGPAKSLQHWNSDSALQNCIPGGSARGPVRELGKLYEVLLSGGSPLLYSDTVRTMTTRHRAEIFDETFQYKMDVGLCFILNSNRDGVQMPYGYGRNASTETFGHSGNQSSCAFADPTRQLAVAWVCNGMPGERRHQQRQRAINNAIYEDISSS